MKKRRTLSTKIGVSGLGVLLTSALMLTGCSNGSSESSSQSSKSPTKKPVSSSVETSTASATPSASVFALKAEPIDISCEKILSLQSLYDFDPNLALTADHKTTLGAVGSQQESLGALSCLLTNLSSQEETQVVVTKLDDASAKHQATLISNPGESESAFQVANGVPGIFSVSGNAGTAQFMTGNYWVSVASKSFTSGIQASPISYLIWNNLK